MAFFQCRPDSFSPLFRLLDDYETHRSTRPQTPRTPPTRTYTPSFDVREGSNGYFLDGELPGVDQSNIEIEFSDPQTLTIKGRTERNYSSDVATNEHEHEHESSPRQHQATVEDDDEEQAASASGSDSDTASTHSQKQKQKQKETVHQVQTQTQTQTQTQDAPSFHFWASERSIGEFQRTFNFGARVDQDGVRASLKNGILSVYVPKEAVRKTKKIRIL